MRNITTVIDQMLALIPQAEKSEHDLRRNLTKIQEEAEWLAPEQVVGLWARGTKILEAYFFPFRVDQLEGWKRAIVDIWTGR
jgi:hypothetical protein